ncbi:APC family permease [Hyphomicrobium sp. 99]|uniref:APC family permease n=1 Tax=Hyphomicrobium sp. 99 TaxID=1163419 RepID=UPI0005F7D77A|nr:amino acid permease [Hyphomicrobium sp. 99]
MKKLVPGEKVSLLRILGPSHVWALGVGIVLVGNYMGWNYSVGKGGALAALLACWMAGLLYSCVAIIDAEVTSSIAAAGGQYSQAKHIVGPAMAFNSGLYLVFSYTMLEAANAMTLGQLLKTAGILAGYQDCSAEPFVALTILSLAWLNYRGVYLTLAFNLVLTAFSFLAIVVLFIVARPWSDEILKHDQFLTELPYGWLGVVAAMHFGLWYYLGIEGTCQAAEEVRSPARALPLGTLIGILTLLLAATMTWYVCVGLMPWQYLAASTAPLFDAARLMNSNILVALMFVGTVFAVVASANGCINDASRVCFAMGRDRYISEWLGAVHPRYRTPNRAIVALVPVALAFSYFARLDEVITFSILSGLLSYTYMGFSIVMFRRQWPLGSIDRGYVSPLHPLPAVLLLILCAVAYFSVFLGYGVELTLVIAFYTVATLWFHFRRYKYVRRGQQFSMPWPKPIGF